LQRPRTVGRVTGTLLVALFVVPTATNVVAGHLLPLDYQSLDRLVSLVAIVGFTVVSLTVAVRRDPEP
jgi:hypothetical protein